MPEPARHVRVVVLVTTRAFAGPLHYLDDGPAPLVVGAVVRAPLGGREVDGVVVEIEADAGEVTQEHRAPSSTRAGACRRPWSRSRSSSRAATTTPARTLALVLPPPPGGPEERFAALAPAADAAAVRGARRRAVVAALGPGPLRVDALRAQTGAAPSVVREVPRRPASSRYPTRPPPRPLAVAAAPRPTAAQAAAIARIGAVLDLPAAERPSGLLLHGVTGSGKTEVFLRAIEHVLRAGRSAIVLVPEIALAPQTAARVAERFGPEVAILHSGLAGGARAEALRRLARGEARVAVGARSAVLAPLVDLGLVVVDEEHDAAYKQDADPRYDARAVALLRARSPRARSRSSPPRRRAPSRGRRSST